MIRPKLRPPSGWRTLAPFFIWLAAFYCCWSALVFYGDYWSDITSHWPIALSMALGSYFAGSTPMGGGTVGFPVLVLLFDEPASIGRNFGLAVQSIGMVSASIYILSSRKPIDWHLLRPALAGTLIGTPFGAAFVAPLVPDLTVKLVFAVIWASFGVMHFIKVKSIVSATGHAAPWHGKDGLIGIVVGLSGGIVASMTGVGIDMMIYAVLVLLYRADLKIAIPTSVILMAVTSVIGITSNILLAMFLPDSFTVAPAVFQNWLAAAPIVALGAPFGAWVVSQLPRTPTLLIVSTLCLAQFAWTIVKEQVHGQELAVAIGGVLAMNVVFQLLYALGGKIQRRATTA